MKKFFTSLLILISISLFSQDEKRLLYYGKQYYPLNEEIKIYYDKDWKPIKLKDSASFYRLISFKAKNIPLGPVEDFHIDDIKQNAFYATYVGLNVRGIDSIFNLVNSAL